MNRILKNIIKKITPSKIINEIVLINDEIDYFEKMIRNQKQSCLMIDMKQVNILTDLYFIKSEINKRFKKYIILKLNEFPLNKACSKEFICNEIDISSYEFSMVMFTNHDHEFSKYTPIEKNGNKYYYSGIYDNGTTIIINDNPDSNYCLVFYEKILFGWKVIEFNDNHYYERIK